MLKYVGALTLLVSVSTYSMENAAPKIEEIKEHASHTKNWPIHFNPTFKKFAATQLPEMVYDAPYIIAGTLLFSSNNLRFRGWALGTCLLGLVIKTGAHHFVVQNKLPHNHEGLVFDYSKILHSKECVPGNNYFKREDKEVENTHSITRMVSNLFKS